MLFISTTNKLYWLKIYKYQHWANITLWHLIMVLLEREFKIVEPMLEKKISFAIFEELPVQISSF